jgi:hypothetical protein
MMAQKGADVSLYSFFKLRSNGVDSQRHDPTGLPYRLETWYLLCRSMGGPTAGLDGGQNFAQTEFRSQDRPALIKLLHRPSKRHVCSTLQGRSYSHYVHLCCSHAVNNFSPLSHVFMVKFTQSAFVSIFLFISHVT